MNWVHCNSCFVQPGLEAPRFIITSCGHIFCVKCVEKASQDKCPVCQCAFTTIELNAEMKPEVRDYFGDPIELSQRALSIARFQAGHTNRLITRLRQYQVKYTAVRSEVMKLSDENIRLRKKLKNMDMVEGWYKTQLASMKRKLALGMTSTQFDADYSPMQSVNVPITPSSDYGSPHLPTVINANQYRSQPNLTPFVTPASSTLSTGYPHGSSAFPRSSNISTGDQRYQTSDRRTQRMQTPAEFSSPSVLRPLNFQSDRHTPLFRRNI